MKKTMGKLMNTVTTGLMKTKSELDEEDDEFVKQIMNYGDGDGKLANLDERENGSEKRALID